MNQENPRTIENLTSHNKFLKIAARQTAGSFFSIGRLHVKAFNDEIGKTSCAVAQNKTAAHQRVAGEISIGRERQFRHSRMTETLLGHIAQSGNTAGMRIELSDGRIKEQNAIGLAQILP